MNNLLLIIVLTFLAICTWNGYRKGFIKIALSMVALAATILIVVNISPHVTKYLKEKTNVYSNIERKTSGFVRDTLGEFGDEITVKTQQILAIDQLYLPSVIRKALTENNNSEIYQLLGVSTFEQYVSSYLACMILNAISFVGSFIVVGFAVQIVIFAADLIGRLPVIKGANKLLGLAFGLAEGIIILWILCLGVTAFGGTKLGQGILAMVHDSVILSFIYNNNLLLNWLTDFLKFLV